LADSNGFLLEDAGFFYDDKAALSGLCLSLAPGRFHGVIGPNGSGKTTLLDLLMGMKTPACGKVSYNGRLVGDYSRRQLARQIALVPQDFQINFGFTVQEVVLMGRHPYMARFDRPRQDDYRLAARAMAALDVDAFVNRLITELSGGEKQRVVVARALTQDTPVLMLDEATSNLDISHTLQILNACHRLVKEQGRTVIAVLHNLNLAAAFCDELLMLRQGRVYASGTPEQVLTAANIKTVFGVESRVDFAAYCNAWQVSYKYFRGRETGAGTQGERRQ
jgi:iron complex transport system ATP-binding protein